MKLSNKMLLSLFTILALGIYLSGCVNLDQKTVLKNDGSGTMKVKYWTKSSNVSGDELAGFGFTEAKAKANYSSSNTEASDIVIKKNATADSLTEVSLNVKFKDFNKLTDAKAFSKIKASYVKGKDGMDFKYVLLEDTANAKQMGMNEYKLTYEFEFPGEVISTNGKKDGKVVKWDNTVADLKDDIEYTATIKSGSKCGLFGLELPIVILFGMSVFYTARRRKK
jgi:hypothetical protein